MTMTPSSQTERLRNETDLCIRTGNPAGAIHCLRRLLAEQPDDATAHYQLGVLLTRAGHLDEALQHCRKAAALVPGNADFLSGVGAILLAGSRISDAIPYVERALEADPGHAASHAQMAIIQYFRGKVADAVPHFERALAAMPERTDLLLTFANACEQLRQADRCRELLDRALALDPANPTALLLQAKLLRRAGDFVQAESTLRGLLDLAPPQVIVVSALKLLGQILDRTERFDDAFAACAQASSISQEIAETLPFDERFYLSLIEQNKATFREPRRVLPEPVPEDGIFRSPVFVVGFPRSGTTLIEQVLLTIPGSTSSSETPLIDQLIREQEDLVEEEIPAFTAAATLDLDSVQRLRRRYFEMARAGVQSLQQETRIIDKLPLNLVQLGFINLVFPESPVIVVLRDPRDCCLSAFMQDFKMNPAMLHMTSLESTARFYDRVMDLWLHYRDVLDMRYLEYRYEDLVGDFDAVTRRLFDFIGEHWNASAAEFYRNAGGQHIRTPSYIDVTSPIYDRALRRWEHYEKHLQPVMPYLQRYIDRFGYAQR
jgi:Flp pilus assembly protein TadD